MRPLLGSWQMVAADADGVEVVAAADLRAVVLGGEDMQPVPGEGLGEASPRGFDVLAGVAADQDGQCH